jgi:hypothetical protein
LIDGVVNTTDESVPYGTNYTVPLGISSLTVGAEAIDLGSNVGTAVDVVIGVIPDPGTTAIGRVVDKTGALIASATVTCLTQVGTTGVDGTFVIPGLPTVQGTIQCSVTGVDSTGKPGRGRSASIPVVLAGNTNVGDILLRGGKIGVWSEGNDTQAIVNAIVASGIVADPADVVNLGSRTQTPLQPLADISVVIYYGNWRPAFAVGDVLADYVDQGGHLVLGMYVFSSPWSLTGRLMTTGLSPFGVSAARFSPTGVLDMSTADMTHPIMQGLTSVSYWRNTNFVNPPLMPGATLIASDTAGNNVVAVNADNSVVGIVMYPVFTTTGQAWQLILNAVQFLR